MPTGLPSKDSLAHSLACSSISAACKLASEVRNKNARVIMEFYHIISKRQRKLATCQQHEHDKKRADFRLPVVESESTEIIACLREAASLDHHRACLERQAHHHL